MPNRHSTDQDEIWKPIPGLADYEASSLGRIRSYKRSTIPRIVKTAEQNNGYLKVPLQKDFKNRKTFLVHRLVALAFIGPRPEGFTIDHRDGNKLNNKPDNLEYVSQSENLKRAFKLGARDQKGEKHPSVKFTEEVIVQIRKEFDSQPYQFGLIKQLAQKYQINQGTMKNIVRRQSWKHLP